jgi:hypothetical protein
MLLWTTIKSTCDALLLLLLLLLCMPTGSNSAALQQCHHAWHPQLQPVPTEGPQGAQQLGFLLVLNVRCGCQCSAAAAAAAAAVLSR